MRDYLFHVYILASCRNGTLYVGMTNDIIGRVWEHREGIGSKFTVKYGVDKLMYFETFEDVYAAIERETRLKKYKRAWKINLIQKDNVEWNDLAAVWFDRKPIAPDWVPVLQA